MLRAQLEAAFDLAGPLALTLRLNLLLQHESQQDVGAELSMIVGLRVGYLGRAVGP